jgi:hypothetical protein
VSEALSLSPSARMAGLAADDLIVSAYFLTLYALARKVPPEAASASPAAATSAATPATTGGTPEAAEGVPALAAAARTAPSEGLAAERQRQQRPEQPAEQQGQTQAGAAQHASGSHDVDDARTITVLHGATALAVAAAICFAGTQIAFALRYNGGSITVITGITGGARWLPWPGFEARGITLPCDGLRLPPVSRAIPHAVTLATLFPGLLAPLRASGEGLAAILMQLFFASVGASGSIAVVMQTAPALFLWSAVAVSSEEGVPVWNEKSSPALRFKTALLSPPPCSTPWAGAGGRAAVWVHPQRELPGIQRQHRR